MTSFTSKLALAAGAFAAQALAHGTVTGFVTDGKYNGGFLLDYYYMEQSGQTPPETAGWYAENLDNGFVDGTGYTSADISCHIGGRPATSTASVSAGGTIEFQWTEWPESHMGPVITYAAPCEGDCADADVEALKWVKIEEAGYESGSWAAVDLIANNNTWVTNVPETLAAGNYVFRHEIIALHAAGSENGAQNYPQCFNIEVTGSGTESPEGVIGAELYTPTDEGILFDPYNGADSYTIPGPALMSGGGSGGSAPPSGDDETETDAPSSAAPTATAAPTASAPAEETDATETEAPVQTDAPEEEETPDVEAPSQGNQEDNTGSDSGSALPETFTLDTFIEWLRETAGSATKARRHARDVRA